MAQDAGGWRRGPDTGTQAGLDPGRPATEASGWYPAPALQADPWTGRRYGADGRDRAGEAPADPGRSWAADDRGAGDPSGSPPGTPAAQSSGHDSGGDGSAGYGATAAGDDTAGHGAAANDTAGYAPAGYGPSQETWGSRNGHASRDHAAQGSDYRPGPAGARHAGYASGDHPAGGAGYQNGHSGSAYAQHEDGNSGYRPARTEHDGPDNETDPGPGGTGYAPLPYGDDARYGQEPYGQAPYYAGPFRNSYDQEPGYGDYPDYDGRR